MRHRGQWRIKRWRFGAQRRRVAKTGAFQPETSARAAYERSRKHRAAPQSGGATSAPTPVARMNAAARRSAGGWREQA